MSHHEALANLGSLISQAETLRGRALLLMQEGPHGPVAEAERRAYELLHDDALTVCGSPGGLAGVDQPGALADVGALHRSAGLLEHELLRRLAEARAAGRGEDGAPLA